MKRHKKKLLIRTMFACFFLWSTTPDATCSCAQSAVTYFSPRPIATPRTTHDIWHKTKPNARRIRTGLVDIKTINPNIVVDLKYASKNNFTGKKIYRTTTCYLKKETALKLDTAQKELESLGLSLKIWDGYRPPEAQKKLWKLVPDQRYVAPPTPGSKHTRGCSVDVTLVDQAGNEIPMPTGFDDFSERAHRDYQQLPPHIKKNRDILTHTMRQHGFIPAAHEWWHFDDSDWRTYPLLDSKK